MEEPKKRTTKRNTKKEEPVIEKKEQPTIEYEEVEVKKEIFYDFIPRWLCRNTLFIFSQMIRIGIAAHVTFLITDGFDAYFPSEYLCDNIWFLNCLEWRWVSFVFLCLGWCQTLGMDMMVFVHENETHELPPLLSISMEGVVYECMMILHVVAFSLYADQCNAALKVASLSYLLIPFITFCRKVVRFCHRHRDYFSRTKKVKMIKKNE